MRTITLIIIHCSATPEGQDFKLEDIDRWHRQRGWNGCGYHYVIELDGTVRKGRDESVVGAHCKGHNKHSIGICYIGGLAQGKEKKTKINPSEGCGPTATASAADISSCEQDSQTEISSSSAVIKDDSQPSSAINRKNKTSYDNDDDNKKASESPSPSGTKVFLRPKDTRTEAQKASLLSLLSALKKRYPRAVILGHRDLNPNKACPCFNAASEYGASPASIPASPRREGASQAEFREHPVGREPAKQGRERHEMPTQPNGDVGLKPETSASLKPKTAVGR